MPLRFPMTAAVEGFLAALWDKWVCFWMV